MSYIVIGNCKNCGKKIIKRYKGQNYIFCSTDCSREYRSKILNQKAYYKKRKLNLCGREIYDPVTIYEQYIYKYFSFLGKKTKEERMSDAWHCFFNMLEEEGINDIFAYHRAIQRFGVKEKNKLYYEIDYEFEKRWSDD